MPIYEYTCHDCQRRVSLLWRSYADAQSREPVCPRCGGTPEKKTNCSLCRGTGFLWVDKTKYLPGEVTAAP